MKKISVYVRSLDVSPSGYYRITQYTHNIDAIVKVHNVLPPSYYRWYLNNHTLGYFYDVFTYLLMYVRVLFFLISDNLCCCNKVVVSRGLLPRYCLFPVNLLLLKISKKASVYWDFDDDILLSKEISKCEFDILSKISSSIVVTHDYLMSKLSKQYICKVIKLPTTDGDFLLMENDKYLKERLTNLQNKIDLVWVGSAVNLIHLEKLIPTLEYCAEYLNANHHKKLVLNICSSKGVFLKTKYLTIQNSVWNKTDAIRLIAISHIGIMPLINTEYALGKGGFKLVQYMAGSLPVIASNVGFNKDIVNESFGVLIDELSDSQAWLTAIARLSTDASTYQQLSKNSLREWKRNYSYENNLKVWSSLLECSISSSANL